MSHAEAQAARQSLQVREAAIRSIGTLHYLIATVGAVTAISAIANGWTTWPMVVATSVTLVFYGCGVSWGLRRLDPRFRSLASVGAGLALLLVPFGTLMGFVILYLLHSDVSQRVFQPAYRRIALKSLATTYTWSWFFSIVWLAYLFIAATATMSFPWIVARFGG